MMQNMLTLIESRLNSLILIIFLRFNPMIEMCSRCYSSGVSVVLDEEKFETICYGCRQ